MPTQNESVPEGYEGATPYLCCRDAAAALAFYERAFGAVETMRLAEPGSGRVGHAEMKIGRATIMLSDEYPDFGVVSPPSIGGSAVTIHLYVDDVDAWHRRAVDAGATSQRPPADQFYGDRTVNLVDPFGHRWMLATRVEEVSAEEMQRLYAAMMKG